MLSLAASWPTVTSASTDLFRQQLLLQTRVTRSVKASMPATESPATALLVQAANHPRNERHVPTPELKPLEVALDVPIPAQDLWFRAEVAAAGHVDSMMFLEPVPPQFADLLKKAIGANLSLRYADARRHRHVVLGKAILDGNGRLVVGDALIKEPLCCICDDDYPIPGPDADPCDCFPCDPCWPC